jgi:hypothetical protein
MIEIINYLKCKFIRYNEREKNFMDYSNYPLNYQLKLL